MLELNRVLLQLNRAVEFANSNFPQERGLAVILFDNLIEVQLFKRIDLLFMRDKTAWYDGNRKYNKENQKEATSKNGKYDKLLKISRDNNILTDSDLETLKYVHVIRNEIYHRGELNELKLDLAIISYYSFLSRKLEIWGSPAMFFSFPGNFPGDAEIDFGQGLRNDDLLFDHKKYFSSALYSIFAKLDIKKDIAQQATSIVREQLRSINQAIYFIKKESRTTNFYAVLGRYWYLNDDFFSFYKIKRKPKNLDSILILYSFLREYRDYLDDIPELHERQKEGRKKLRKYRQLCNGNYPYWQDLSKIEKRLKSFESKTERSLLQILTDIESKLAHLYSDTEEAALDLDGYIQSKIDDAKGK